MSVDFTLITGLKEIEGFSTSALQAYFIWNSQRFLEFHTIWYFLGSPFQFTVGPLRDSGAHLVKAGGAGLERGEAGRFNEFNVWTREAGAGQLAISLEGPSKVRFLEFSTKKVWYLTRANKLFLKIKNTLFLACLLTILGVGIILLYVTQ